MSETNDIIKKANEYKAMLAERARNNYNIRKSEGRQPTHPIPKEEHKKRGPKPKPPAEPKAKTPIRKQNPKTRGRKTDTIDNILNIPAYINRLIKNDDTESEQLEPIEDDMNITDNTTNIYKNEQAEQERPAKGANSILKQFREHLNDENYFIHISKYSQDERIAFYNLYKVLVGNDDEQLLYDIYITRHDKKHKIIKISSAFGNLQFIINYNTYDGTYRIKKLNINTCSYNFKDVKDKLNILFEIILNEYEPQ